MHINRCHRRLTWKHIYIYIYTYRFVHMTIHACLVVRCSSWVNSIGAFSPMMARHVDYVRSRMTMNNDDHCRGCTVNQRKVIFQRLYNHQLDEYSYLIIDRYRQQSTLFDFVDKWNKTRIMKATYVVFITIKGHWTSVTSKTSYLFD
jgi:hypothetical protein